MELTYKDYKRINNTGNLPKFENGFVSPWKMIQNNGGFNNYTRSAISQGGNNKLPTESWQIPFSNSPKTQQSVNTFDMSKGGDVVSTGINFVGSAVNAFSQDKDEQDLSADYGQTNATINGIGYIKPNYADMSKEMDSIRKQNLTNTLGAAGSGAAFGAAVGSIIPGFGTAAGAVVGGALGAILGGAGSAERARKHRQLVARFNDKVYNLGQEYRGAAFTKGLRLNNAKEYGNSEDQYLFGAKDGKISSAEGPTDKKATARVSNGEIIANKYNGTMYRVPGKKNNKDTKLAAVKDSDTIITNKYGLSDYVAATGDIEGAEEMMNLMNKQKLFRASKGKLPHFEEGWIPNAISSGATMLGGLTQYLDAKNQSVKKPNSYVSNPYELEALSTLAGLRINPYPIMQQLRSAESRTNNAIDRSGGLGVGQRPLSRLAVLNTTQNNISNTLSSIQQQNNGYLSDYAKTALQSGANNAKMKMAADQYDLDYYSKAHAARQQGMQAGMYNMINSLQQYYANDFKRRQFNDMMGLYREQLDIDKQKTLADISNMAFNQKQAQKQSQSQTALNPYQWLAFGPAGYYGAMQYNRKLATKHS